jgi:NADH:ubiquinone oxidoreductase subunit E
MHHSTNMESVNPDLTSEVMAQVDEVIDRHKGKQGCLIPVLEECQGIVGYLPVELQDYIGDRTIFPGATYMASSLFIPFFQWFPRDGTPLRSVWGLPAMCEKSVR